MTCACPRHVCRPRLRGLRPEGGAAGALLSRPVRDDGGDGRIRGGEEFRAKSTPQFTRKRTRTTHCPTRVSPPTAEPPPLPQPPSPNPLSFSHSQHFARVETLTCVGIVARELASPRLWGGPRGGGGWVGGEPSHTHTHLAPQGKSWHPGKYASVAGRAAVHDGATWRPGKYASMAGAMAGLPRAVSQWVGGTHFHVVHTSWR